jgi:alpha-tubulin suppressor-like RCC1 family protein
MKTIIQNIVKPFILSFLLFTSAEVSAQCWKAISCGYNHTLAIKTDGTLWAWGVNTFGQLGDGTNTDRIIQTQIGTETNWSQVSAGDYHSTALKNDGSLWVWGFGLWGVLGDGTTTNKDVPTFIGNNWSKISAGNFYTLGIKTDGSLWAWGQNDYGQVGNGTTTSFITLPTQIATGNWSQIATAGYSSIALNSNGTIWTWGRNSSGTLGDGTTSNKYVPTQMGTDTNWSQISAGLGFVLALKNNNTLWGWGNNNVHQLGDGTYGIYSYLSPIKIGSNTNWSQISAGYHHSLALNSNGNLFGWGSNNQRQAGAGTADIILPTMIGSGTDWYKIAAGYMQSKALKTDNSLWVWGTNISGQFGNGTTNPDYGVPVNVSCPTNLTIKDNQDIVDSFKLYPNPAKNILTIQTPENHTIDKITITDLTGKKVLEQKGNSNTINVEKLQQGTYLLQTNSEGKNSITKFMKN